MLKHKKTIIALSIIPQYLGIKLLAQFPDFVECYYSNGLYVFISKLTRYVFGWIPFSVGDVFYTIASIYILRWLFINRKRIFKDTKNWAVDVLAAVSIGYFAFHLFWGFNYYRLPLHESIDIKNEYTTESLIAFTKTLIEKANATHVSITNNPDIMVTLPYHKGDVLNRVPKGYEVLSHQFKHLKYTSQSLKFSVYSLSLTYMGFSGYLNPFTNEAQINGKIYPFKYPTTASHEAAHQLGYAAENEANFIGCLAAMRHDDKYFNYSGEIFALKHCLNEVFIRDKVQYDALRQSINPGILKNYKLAGDFWKAYKTPMEPVFKTTYSGFLKANNQTDGIESYNYVVALLVNYFEDNDL